MVYRPTSKYLRVQRWTRVGHRNSLAKERQWQVDGIRLMGGRYWLEAVTELSERGLLSLLLSVPAVSPNTKLIEWATHELNHSSSGWLPRCFRACPAHILLSIYCAQALRRRRGRQTGGVWALTSRPPRGRLQGPSKQGCLLHQTGRLMGYATRRRVCRLLFHCFGQN